jgi:hypothetical protein
MIQEYKNKELKSESKSVRLKCVRECWAPGLGEFKAGEILSGTDLVEKLKENPNFIEFKEEA